MIYQMSSLCEVCVGKLQVSSLCRDCAMIYQMLSPCEIFAMIYQMSSLYDVWAVIHQMSFLYEVCATSHQMSSLCEFCVMIHQMSSLCGVSAIFHPMSYLYGFPKTKQYMTSQCFQACYTFLCILFCLMSSRLRQFSSIKRVDSFHVNHQIVCVNCNVFFSWEGIISIALFQDSLLLSVPYFTLSIFTLIWGKCLDIGRTKKFITTTAARKMSMFLGE